ncbi:MAG: hypothetical protein ACRDSH_21990 [Pseudonocardiaceae bacterium]
MSLTNTYPADSLYVAPRANLAIPIGVRYEQRIGGASGILSVSDTLAVYDLAVETNTDVEPWDVQDSGFGNTGYLLKRIGRWSVSAAMRYAGDSGGGERHIFIQEWVDAFDTSKRIASQTNTNVGSVPVTVTCSTSFRIAAPTTIVVALFQNSGHLMSTDVGYGGTNHIALTWDGP